MDISGPRITPSRPDYWVGSPAKNGLTVEQNETLEKETVRRARDNALRRGLPRFIVHELRVEPRQQDQAVYYRYIICPVIGGRNDRTKFLVIAPNGLETWIEPK